MKKYNVVPIYDQMDEHMDTKFPYLMRFNMPSYFNCYNVISRLVNRYFSQQEVVINESITNKETRQNIITYLDKTLMENRVDTSDPNKKMCHWKCSVIFNHIMSNVKLPAHCYSWLDADHFSWFPYWKWVIMGPSRAVTPLHTDIINTSSWNLLLSGLKIWIFIPPTSHINGNLLLKRNIEHNIPLPKNLYITVQRSSDLVWIPSGWQHEVYYLSPCICLSENLINDTSILPILQSLETDKSFFKRKLQLLYLAQKRW